MAELDEDDMLEVIFDKQRKLMDELVFHDKLPDYPVNMSSKHGQRLIKEMIFACVEELCEASYTLKNKVHRMSDARDVDLAHYREELGDSLAYFIEICLLSGMTASDVFSEYKRKHDIVMERIKDGY